MLTPPPQGEIRWINKDRATKTIVMMHGRGSNAGNILSLFSTIGNFSFRAVAPNAAEGSWYPRSFTAPIAENEPYLSSAIDWISRILSELNIKSEETFFVGFSQGACLIAEYLARNPAKWGGAFIFTGSIITPVQELKREVNYHGTPIFLSTGDPDQYVPLEKVVATKEFFSEQGADVSLRIIPNKPHSIGNEELRTAKEFFLRFKEA